MKFILDTKQIITYIFVVVAVAIVVASLWFSNKLVSELSIEERNKIEIWAEATKQIATETEGSDMNLILHILQSNTTIPVILHDVHSDTYVANNIKVSSITENDFLRNKAINFARKHEPIVLEELNQNLYYDDSYTLKWLSLYPYVQLSVLIVFISLAFFALSSSMRAEQNKVWMGLSKETAHQLGTPISSLMAWIELMKLRDDDNDLLDEVDKDLKRLDLIVERFSKIGSKSDLSRVDLKMVIDNAVMYMERRISSKVKVVVIVPDYDLNANINEPLFEWVIENLIKNATDAMGGIGQITFELFEKGSKIVLEITDTGKGIERARFKKIFKPGYTTKSRGWGLGLSLVKRIVEDYHRGRIYVKSSEIDKGTVFRIVLPTST